mgnify:CR=1 FL=1
MFALLNAEDFVKMNILFAKFADTGWYGTTPLIQGRVASDNPTPNSIPYFPLIMNWVTSQFTIDVGFQFGFELSP